MEKRAYSDEIESFRQLFRDYKSSRIILYGIGRYSAVLVPVLQGEFHFVGLMDRNPENIGKKLLDLPVVSLKEAEIIGDLIIINTSETYWGVIYNRIKESKIPVYFLNGERAVNMDNTAMDTYRSISKLDLLSELKQYDVISFDVFDTLIMRKVLLPRDVFFLLDERNNTRWKDKELLMSRVEVVRDISDEFYDLKAVYDSLEKKLEITDVERDKLYKDELDIEELVCTPRKEMVDLVNTLSKKKRIYIISDMYLSKGFICRLLKKHGLICDVPIWISSEEKMDKKRGEIWRRLIGENEGKRIVHVGDNKESDYLSPRKYGISSIQIPSASKLWEESTAKGYISKISTSEESIFAGLICSRLFSNPFILNNSHGRVIINSYEDIGYVLIGGAVISFLDWLLKIAREQKIERIFFFARDGYWLVRYYEYMVSELNIENAPAAEYFPISRCVVMISSFPEDGSWGDLLTYPYVGKFSNFVRNRMHIRLPQKDSHHEDIISLPQQEKEIEKWLEPYKDRIQRKMMAEKNSYMCFLREKKICEKDAFVDLWYNGNNQFYLSKTLKMRLKGFYFAVNKNKSNICAENNDMYSCFQKDDDLSARNCNIKKMAQFYETVFTAPHGMILSVAKDGRCKYSAKMGNQKHWNSRNKIDKGVRDFIHDYLQLKCKVINPLSFDLFLNEFFNGNISISNRITSSFYYDNVFIKDSEERVFE